MTNLFVSQAAAQPTIVTVRCVRPNGAAAADLMSSRTVKAKQQQQQQHQHQQRKISERTSVWINLNWLMCENGIFKYLCVCVCVCMCVCLSEDGQVWLMNSCVKIIVFIFHSLSSLPLESSRQSLSLENWGTLNPCDYPRKRRQKKTHAL